MNILAMAKVENKIETGKRFDEKFQKKVLARCNITINFADNKPQKPTYMDENTRNYITTIATIIAIVCAVLNCIVTAISLCAAN